jgi:prophage antirepressor-like protein
MQDMVPFIYPLAKAPAPVRVVIRDGEPWFVATDVAHILGFRDAEKATRFLDAAEKGTQIVGTLGGDQELSIISESGLYGLAFRSRKPTAKAFRRWVTGEVLPTIRKTGAWGQPALDLAKVTSFLHQHQLRVLEAIRGLVSDDDGKAHVRSVGTIAEIAGLSTAATYRHIALLCILGLLVLSPDERLRRMVEGDQRR